MAKFLGDAPACIEKEFSSVAAFSSENTRTNAVHRGPDFADRRLRERILRLLLSEFSRNLQSMPKIDQRVAAATSRRVVEAWLRCQGLIEIRRQPTTKEKCVTHFPEFWSDN